MLRLALSLLSTSAAAYTLSFQTDVAAGAPRGLWKPWTGNHHAAAGYGAGGQCLERACVGGMAHADVVGVHDRDAFVGSEAEPFCKP